MTRVISEPRVHRVLRELPVPKVQLVPRVQVVPREFKEFKV